MTASPYRFSQRVDSYVKYRPRYPQVVLDLLRAECQLSRAHVIADIGSGTGILSELVPKHGNPVYGVESDPDMRAGAEHYLRGSPKFVSIVAAAEATTRSDHGIDFVTAGQAFHWFDVVQARKECAGPGAGRLGGARLERTANQPHTVSGSVAGVSGKFRFGAKGVAVWCTANSGRRNDAG